LAGAIISFVYSGNDSSRPDDIVCGTLTGTHASWQTVTCREDIPVAAQGAQAHGILQITFAAGQAIKFCGIKVYGTDKDSAT
jgi:hypothetical protein